VELQKANLREEDIKRWANHIAIICLSEEFQLLKSELESIYLKSGVENFRLVAFQDALYAFLAQKESEEAVS
jgi:hypothetical protein